MRQRSLPSCVLPLALAALAACATTQRELPRESFATALPLAEEQCQTARDYVAGPSGEQVWTAIEKSLASCQAEALMERRDRLPKSGSVTFVLDALDFVLALDGKGSTTAFASKPESALTDCAARKLSGQKFEPPADRAALRQAHHRRASRRSRPVPGGSKRRPEDPAEALRHPLTVGS